MRGVPSTKSSKNTAGLFANQNLKITYRMSDFRTQARCFKYRPMAVLKVTGEDAFTFLQGQFTQDLRPARDEARAAYGLWLNQKGKVLADSFLLRYGADWLCVSLFSAAETIRERLETYIIADDVMIEDMTAQWAGTAMFGPGAVEFIEENVGGRPLGTGLVATTKYGFIFPGRRVAEPNWEWLYPVGGDETAMQFDEQIGFAESERLRIEALIPSVPRDVGPEDLPNEGGLDHDAISYTKGCYLGQEVMARLKTMGQVRRRLMRLSGRMAPPEILPAPLFADGKRIGELRSAASVKDGFVGLAMISLLGLGQRQLLGLSPDGPADLAITDNLG
jgi:folate-binding protein YgfZ